VVVVAVVEEELPLNEIEPQTPCSKASSLLSIVAYEWNREKGGE
jgi:hypothetical protein